LSRTIGFPPSRVSWFSTNVTARSGSRATTVSQVGIQRSRNAGSSHRALYMSRSGKSNAEIGLSFHAFTSAIQFVIGRAPSQCSATPNGLNGAPSRTYRYSWMAATVQLP
jgi:hypothetical protein